MKRYRALVLPVLALLVFFGAHVEHARAANPFVDITFPITELGNCGSLHECFTYCNVQANQDACTAFAEAHGLAPRPPRVAAGGDENLPHGPNGQNVASILAKGGGPGGCTTPDSCKAYCDDIHHIDECLAFGKAHNLLSPDEIAEGEKVAAAVKNGAVPPGNCSSRDECQKYCSDPSHRDECVAFAEKTGLGPPPGALGPGGPGGPPIAGPGGCNSPESCAQFCNDPANQETCIAFAKAHGFIQEDDERGANNALSHIAEGLAHAPPEVEDCLKSVVGKDGFAALQNGTPPSLDQMNQVRQCFEQFKPQTEAQFHRQFEASDQVKSCITQTLGPDAVSQLESASAPPDPETASKIRTCFDRNPQGHPDQNPGSGPESDNEQHARGPGSQGPGGPDSHDRFFGPMQPLPPQGFSPRGEDHEQDRGGPGDDSRGGRMPPPGFNGDGGGNNFGPPPGAFQNGMPPQGGGQEPNVPPPPFPPFSQPPIPPSNGSASSSTSFLKFFDTLSANALSGIKRLLNEFHR